MALKESIMCVQENYINHKPVIAKDEAMHMKVRAYRCACMLPNALQEHPPRLCESQR